MYIKLDYNQHIIAQKFNHSYNLSQKDLTIEMEVIYLFILLNLRKSQLNK